MLTCIINNTIRFDKYDRLYVIPSWTLMFQSKLIGEPSQQHTRSDDAFDKTSVGSILDEIL